MIELLHQTNLLQEEGVIAALPFIHHFEREQLVVLEMAGHQYAAFGATQVLQVFEGRVYMRHHIHFVFVFVFVVIAVSLRRRIRSG